MIQSDAITTSPTTQQAIDPTVLYWYNKLARSPVLANLQEGLALYFSKGITPGSFLTAVLENDLREAVARGSIDSQAHLVSLVRWLHNNAPAHSWGSVEAVESWRASFMEGK